MTTGFPAPFTPFEVPWDRPQLAEEELSSSSAFEWWYFDLASADGTSLVVVFSRRNPVLCSGGASIYLEYQRGPARLRRVHNYPATAFSVQAVDGGFALHIAGHRLDVIGNDPAQLAYRLRVALPEFGLDLEMHPEHRGFLPTPDGCYFRGVEDPSRRTCVSFSAPLMRAAGSITFQGQATPVTGRGYHDHPWGTAQLFATHRQWNWARMTNPAMGAMFARVTPRSDFTGTLAFMYQAQFGTFEPTVSAALQLTTSDWRRAGLLGIRFPHVVHVATDRPLGEATLTCQSSLLDTPMYDRSSVAWRAGAGPPGTGWVEYYDLPGWLSGLAFLGARIAAFFWRPFPWFGR